MYKSQVTYDSSTKLLGRCYQFPSGRIILEIVPDSLIRIQLRRIRGKIKETETILYRFSKTFNAFGFMRGMTINDQKYRSFSIMKQPFYKFNKSSRSYSPLDCHKTELSLGTDRRDKAQSKSCAGTADHRGFAFNRPSRAGMMIRANACFITKKYLRLLLTSQLSNTGIILLQPLLNFFRTLLVRTPYGTLRRQSQLPQQPSNRSLADPDPKSLVNELPDHLGRPQRKGEFELQRILHSYRLVDPADSLGIELGLAPSSFARIQGRPSTTAIACQPSVDRHPVDAQCLSNGFRTLTFLHAGNGTFSQLSQRRMCKFSSIHTFLFHGC